MKVPKKIKDEIWEYCRLNNISDIDTFMLKTLQQGFNIEKYGTTPFKIGGKELEVIEKEVIKVITATTEVEIVREVPVEIEVIKEVEKIVEVTVTDNELIDKLNKEKDDLGGEIIKLENSLEKERKKVDELSNSDAGVINSLNQKIKNLKTELEIEKNRNYETPKKEKPKEDKNSKLGLNNIIKWVSRDARKEDLYDE
tara:strand:- start:16046 stop:16639 length:594 start_codon:yes stop_codon:yes gene_type:complete